jgi:hypothetical protein
MLVIALAALSLAGCGDDDGGGGGGQAAKPKTVRIELSGSGTKLRFSVPRSVPGGVVRIEFVNSAEGEHGAQLGYVDEGHTPQEGLQAAAAWGERGKALPGWLHLPGGVGSIASGDSSSVTQELPAGRYFVVDIDSNAAAYFRVAGGAGAGEQPSAPAKIEATEYRFTASGLEAGANRVLFDNAGGEPHFVAGVRIKPGKTIEDVRKFVRTEKGEEPFAQGGNFNTAVVDGGVTQTVEVEAQPGKYALLCFVPDRKGGPPHAVKGMISEATVR